MGIVILALILVGVSVFAAFAAKKWFEMGIGAIVTLVVCLVFSGLTTWWTWSTTYHNEHWATCHVTSKDRGGDDGSYRVYTDNCDTLANEDSLFRDKWNSSNVWQQIEPNHTYRFRIVGVRIPFLSQFANILEVQPADV